MVFPFIWMVLTSVKALGQLLNAPLSLLPDPFTWDNYIKLERGGVPAGVLELGLHRGAQRGRHADHLGRSGLRIRPDPFRGSGVLFVIFLATQMIPKQVTLIPPMW